MSLRREAGALAARLSESTASGAFSSCVALKAEASARHPFAASGPILLPVLFLARRRRLSLGEPPGPDCRPAGVAANPKPLVQFEEGHPYYMAMYDLPDGGWETRDHQRLRATR